jgi:DNA-binding NarL/FixJ family response regulator
MKLLILDNQPIMHLVFESLLKEVGYEGEQLFFNELGDALLAIDSQLPDFVITDIQIDQRKQLEVLSLCAERKIPYMVYTSHVNYYIIDFGRKHGMRCFVSKTAPIRDLIDGLRSLLNGQSYSCSMTMQFLDRQGAVDEQIPQVLFTHAEEDVILGQIAGKSSIQLSIDTHKSKFTIRNQRMSLMEKNQCTMEEIARRYLYWHTSG